MLPIRRATINDVDQLVQLRLLLFKDAGEVADVEAVTEATYTYLTKSLTQGTFLAWIAENDRRIVATSSLVIFERPPAPGNLSGKEGYVLNMYTLPEFRGQGLATALLQEITHFAKEATVRRLWLHATESGRPVYEKAGFLAEPSAMELVW